MIFSDARLFQVVVGLVANIKLHVASHSDIRNEIYEMNSQLVELMAIIG